MEEINERESWNKKRVVIVLLTIILLGFGVKTFVFDANKSEEVISKKFLKSVKGIGTGEKLSSQDKSKNPSFPQNLNLEKSLQQRLEGLKQEVQNLDVLDIASSSPQVQKVLRDLKELEQYPRSQAQELCQRICSSF